MKKLVTLRMNLKCMGEIIKVVLGALEMKSLKKIKQKGRSTFFCKKCQK